MTLVVTQLFDMVKALGMCAYPTACPEQPHFKAAHTMAGLLYIATNTYEEQDALRIQHGGRLATWDGVSANWTILERTAFVEVTGRHNMGAVVFAMGWDDASVILKVLETGADMPAYGGTTTYRLPKASHAYDHLWTTEWPRIREVESERYLIDMHGMFYELPSFAYGGAAWGIKPVSQHLRMVPDFASYRGFLVLGGNQVSSIFDNNWVTGQAQSGLWFGKVRHAHHATPARCARDPNRRAHDPKPPDGRPLDFWRQAAGLGRPVALRRRRRRRAVRLLSHDWLCEQGRPLPRGRAVGRLCEQPRAQRLVARLAHAAPRARRGRSRHFHDPNRL